MLVILGATASGKTALATQLAARLSGEIISADSRQIYRELDISTGKDLTDYCVAGKSIPYHLIDIHDVGYKYNVFEYQQDFLSVYNDITRRKRLPILCGGSGMYLDAVIRGYKMKKVPINEPLRAELSTKSITELSEILSSYKTMHNISDIDTAKRAIRAIEIAEFERQNSSPQTNFPQIDTTIIGIQSDRETQRRRISQRLRNRLAGGMIEEIQHLLDNGVAAETLIYYGLECKYLVWYLQGKLTLEEMTKQLETAIHQFAKRQMTWFRRMERQGIPIHWIDGKKDLEQQVEEALRLGNSITRPLL